MEQQPFALSVKVLVLDDQGRVLLLRRSMTSKNNKGKWDLPGGKVDEGEHFDEALLREVAEEAGLSITLERVAGATESELPDRKVAYLLMEGRLLSGEVQLSDEHDDCQWVPRGELASIDTCPQFRAFLASYARGACKKP